MNGLNGARVVLLDDEAAAALPVIKAFSSGGVPVAYFDGKQGELPKQNQKLRGVRLAILDMDLGFGGSNENIAATLVQTFSRIIDPDNGPYGILIWTNHPDLKEKVAKYIYEHEFLPNPVFIEMLRKAKFKMSGKARGQFSIRKLSKALLDILEENSPLECMQIWEGACFRASTNVTNSIGDMSTHGVADLDQWRKAWRDETLKLLFVISKAYAEEHHTEENCVPSIFLALDPLHSDRMDALVEEVASGLSSHAQKIMAAGGGAAIERKAKVNSMLHLAFDRLDTFSPGNIYVFGKRNRPPFMPSIKDTLQDCVQGNAAQQQQNLADILKHAHLCGLEVTPACDYAQNKMGLSRIVTGFLLSEAHQRKIKSAQFLKAAGPFYLSHKPFTEGAYIIYLNSRYVASPKPSEVKPLRAFARIRAQLLADVQAWASYQSARQGVILLR
jgi:hypothetical protein